ncbi:cell wall protein DAN4-like, partial [Copidosoma floridanum]|uniref:cell wall protein DAN4-like n=1 Tax=Copidosoma floridanum TaxID=29053 RepID=UPI0006C9BAC8
ASSSSSDGSASTGRIYKKVAIVENFFDIIHAVHVDLEGRPGKHAGQKRTYRTITETYAFLPREAVTRFLLGCTECQRRPRTPSPTSLAAVATATATTTATKNDIPTISRTPTPTTPIDSPPSPKPATTLANSSTPTPDDADKPKEASDPPETGSPSNENSQDQPKAEIKLETEEPAKTTTTAVTETTEATTTSTVKTENIDGDATTTSATSETDNSSNVSVAKIKAEKYNPLSITNLLRKDPVSRRPPIALVPKSESALSTAAITTTTTTTSTTTIFPSVTESSLPVAGDCPVAKCAPMDYSWTGDEVSRDFLPAAGLIGQNLNLLATIQQLHCQVMLALTQRLRPSEPSHGSPPSAARNNAEEPGS